MTIETVPNSELQYYLISFDKRGSERSDDPDSKTGRLSQDFESKLLSKPITDVFFISHGWKGDIPAAKQQYDDWIGAMLTCDDDIASIRAADPNFEPLIAGLHWPSLPWGDEGQQSEVSFGAPGTAGPSLDDLIDDAADKVCDTPRVREALRVIFESALDDIEPAKLPAEVVDAYNTIYAELGIGSDGPAGAPGDDAEAFNAQDMYAAARADEAFDFGGGSLANGLLSPLRQLSFWKMKKRARKFGESGAGDLLRRLQQATDGENPVRFHLMGHSFGCIVVSSCIAGAAGDAPLPRPVHSAYLVQGAFSIWSYCDDIPVDRGRQGYFNSIVRGDKVSGPIMTTQSTFDTAVGKLYPLAAGIKGQVKYAVTDPPKYAAVGSFSIRGPGVEPVDIDMRPTSEAYNYQRSKIYNIESGEFICEGGGVSGAHSDISKPEVAHVF